MAAPSSGLSQSSLTRACGPEFCACERDRALQRRDSESIRIKQHKAGQRAAERHPSESERSEKRQSIKNTSVEREWKQEQHPRKKIFCSVPVARCAHSTPSLPWGRMEFDRCAPAAESRAEGAACDPHLKQQGWRRALLVTFLPESSSLQQPLSKHRAPQLWGDAACRNRNPPACPVRLTQTSSLLGSAGKQIHCLRLPLEFRAAEWERQGMDQFNCGLCVGKGCSFIKALSYHSHSRRCKGQREEEHRYLPSDAVGGG